MKGKLYVITLIMVCGVMQLSCSMKTEMNKVSDIAIASKKVERLAEDASIEERESAQVSPSKTFPLEANQTIEAENPDSEGNWRILIRYRDTASETERYYEGYVGKEPDGERLVSSLRIAEDKYRYNDEDKYYYYEFGPEKVEEYFGLLKEIRENEEYFFSHSEFENIEYGKMNTEYRTKDEYILISWGPFVTEDYSYSYEIVVSNDLGEPLQEFEYVRDYMISEFFQTTLKYPVIDHKRTPGSDLSDRRQAG